MRTSATGVRLQSDTLPPGWAEATIGELCLSILKHGPRERPSERFTYIDIGSIAGNRIVEAKELFGSEAPSRARQFVHAGDTVLSTVRTYLKKTALVPEELHGATASTGFCVLRPAVGVEPRFVFYRTLEHGFVAELSKRQTGSSYPAVRDNDVLVQRVWLPPLNEQRRIVVAIEEHLSRLDAADASLTAATQRLRGLRAGVLNSAFDFNGEAVTIGAIATVGSGATPKRGRSEFWEGGTIPWVTSGQLNVSRVNEPAALITEQALRETNVKLWPPGTLLVALYGEGQTRGRCAELTFESTTNQACAAVVLDEDTADRGYVRRFFDARYEANRRLASGGVQPNLSLGLIKAMTIPLPPLEEQRRIVAQVEEQLSAIDALRAAIERAQQRSQSLRRAVLERAFRGELVPQDPTDEPAEALLARIRAERGATQSGARRPRTSK